jgi:hypothetical protein
MERMKASARRSEAAISPLRCEGCALRHAARRAVKRGQQTRAGRERAGPYCKPCIATGARTASEGGCAARRGGGLAHASETAVRATARALLTCGRRTAR